MVQLNDKNNKQKKNRGGGYKKTSNESQKMKAANVSFFGLDERVKIKYENSG